MVGTMSSGRLPQNWTAGPAQLASSFSTALQGGLFPAELAEALYSMCLFYGQGFLLFMKGRQSSTGQLCLARLSVGERDLKNASIQPFWPILDEAMSVAAWSQL